MSSLLFQSGQITISKVATHSGPPPPPAAGAPVTPKIVISRIEGAADRVVTVSGPKKGVPGEEDEEKKKVASRKRRAKEAARVEVERKRRLLQEDPALPRDFGLAHDHDKSLPAGAPRDLEYECMECLKSFASSGDLLAHLVRHRPTDAPPSRKVNIGRSP